MAKVMVGVIAHRREDGTFLPAQPIYREIPEFPEDSYEHYPFERIVDYFAEKYLAHLRALRKLDEQAKRNSLQDH